MLRRALRPWWRSHWKPIPKDAVGLEEIALAKIDPMRIAGQIRSLRSKIRRSAKPVGGHNGVAVALIAGNNSAVSAMPK